MSTYREIVGKKIKKVSSDPSSGTDGEMWYNSTTQSLRGLKFLQAWASSGSLVQDYRQGGYAGATQSSYMIFGGYPIPTNNTKTFEYNGSGWAAGGNLGTGKYLNGGAGTQTAGLDYGGYNGSAPITIPGGNVTQEYNGTAWSDASATMGTARYNCLGSGTQTAALSAAGIAAPPANASTANNNFSEEYNGSSWSEGNNLNTPRNTSGSQSGTQTAAIMFGGFAYPSSYKADVENYDGTSWTSGTSLPAGRSRAGTAGTQTDALVFGGNLPPVTDTCFSWDGTTFSAVPALSTARQGGGNSQNAPSTGAVLAGGSPSPKTVTEEFNSSTNVITAAAWSSGATKTTSTTQQEAGTDGPRDAFALWGGRTVPANTTNLTEEFNGTSWAAGGTLGTAARKREGGGILTAAWCANGEQPAYIDNVEEYDGTSWSEVNNTPGASSLIGGSGPQTAGIACLGQLPGGAYPKATLEYDGTNWTSGGNTSTARTSSSAGQVGPQTAALISGGEPTPIANTEQYDGTSWSEVADLITALGQACDGTFGVQTAAIQCGGKTSPSPGAGVTTAQSWNGTNWATSPNLGQARKSHSTSGSTTAGIITAGQTTTTPTVLTSSEEYDGETTAANVKTFSTS